MATRSLMATPIRELADWQFVDSSQRSQPPPSFLVRGALAFRRTIQSIRTLLRRKTTASLIFVPYLTASLCEKLLVAWFSGLMGKRTVVTFRSEIKPQGRFERLLRPLFRRALLRCDSIVLQSELAQEGLRHLYPDVDDRVEVIPNWIECDRPQRSFAQTQGFEAPPRALFIGWLESTKGTIELLTAVKRLHERGLTCSLSLCGSGSQADELPKLAADLEIATQVRFLGWVDEAGKEEQFRSTDLLVLPSYTEGMPNAVLEAMASGLPIVATNVGSLPQLVVDGHGGFLVDPHEIEPLADAMFRVLSNPELKEQMGRFNRRRVLEKHNVEHAWRRIATLLGIDYSNQSIEESSEKTAGEPIST